MSTGIGRKAATAQTLIAQSAAATEHAHCAKATIKSPPDCTKHPHARISFQQLIAYCCRPKTNPGLPTETRGLRWVELRGHVSNSCRLAITFCWWLWQREARSFPLIHEQNQKAPCKGGQIIGFAIEYHCPAWSPRGEAQPPISFKRDEDRT